MKYQSQGNTFVQWTIWMWGCGIETFKRECNLLQDSLGISKSDVRSIFFEKHIHIKQEWHIYWDKTMIFFQVLFSFSSAGHLWSTRQSETSLIRQIDKKLRNAGLILFGWCALFIGLCNAYVSDSCKLANVLRGATPSSNRPRQVRCRFSRHSDSNYSIFFKISEV